MRLTQIKLAGFKSFAEPTTFQLPGQRVGVVGPNGCGKSNIIDAVRWVLGESKASELRGESMQDVIFNGSGTRKPAGRASVELVFDNSLARAGGQCNAFAEIAVKRVLTRDGSSSYFINNQPVRRRDIAVARSLDSARLRSEGRVQRFLDAGFELLSRAESGKEFTVQEVVDRSGQSLRSFYKYFAGKHELLLALFDEAREAFDRVLAARKGTDLAARAQFMRGETYFHQNQYKDALREFYRVILQHNAPEWQAAALLEAVLDVCEKANVFPPHT